MAGTFTFDMKALQQALAKSIPATGEGLRDGLNDVKNDWLTESEQIAPLQDGHLREALDGTVNDLSVEVGVKASDLHRTSGKAFNYAAYIHDYDGRAVTGEKKFLDVVAQTNQADWERIMERSVEKSLKKAGWR